MGEGGFQREGIGMSMDERKRERKKEREEGKEEEKKGRRIPVVPAGWPVSPDRLRCLCLAVVDGVGSGWPTRDKILWGSANNKQDVPEPTTLESATAYHWLLSGNSDIDWPFLECISSVLLSYSGLVERLPLNRRTRHSINISTFTDGLFDGNLRYDLRYCIITEYDNITMQ